jgi:hypothetical protein
MTAGKSLAFRPSRLLKLGGTCLYGQPGATKDRQTEGELGLGAKNTKYAEFYVETNIR